MEAKKIPANIDYKAIDGLATEAVEKLTKIQPETLAQASRISVSTQLISQFLQFISNREELRRRQKNKKKAVTLMSRLFDS